MAKVELFNAAKKALGGLEKPQTAVSDWIERLSSEKYAGELVLPRSDLASSLRHQSRSTTAWSSLSRGARSSPLT
jgi:hypothetical protein